MSDVPQLYLRRCNGWPREGMPVPRSAVEDYLAHLHRTGATEANGDLDTGVRVLAPAGRPWEVEAPGTIPRIFTFEPVPAGVRRRT